MTQPIHVKVNGQNYIFEIQPWQTLLEVLRKSSSLSRPKRVAA